MKRLSLNKDPPVHRRGSIRVVVLTPVYVCLLLAFGASWALGAKPAGGPVSVPGTKPNWTPGRAVHILPPPAAVHTQPEALAFAKERCEPKYCPIPPLLYEEGAGVQVKPVLRLILWGKDWAKGIGSKLAVKLANVYKGISGSNYQGILTQYFESITRIGKTLTLTSYTDTKVEAPTNVNDAKIQEEVSKAISANGWVNEFNEQFIVVPSPGSTYEAGFNTGFCGYHGKTTTISPNYTFVAYAGDEPFSKAGCLNFDATHNAENSTTSIATHEYAESATDPNPKAPTWTTGGATKYEIGDICATEDDELPGGLWVQGEWDNFQGECSISDATPAFVYAVTEPATSIGASSMVLNGSINPESMKTVYHFEYGTSSKYENTTSKVSAGNGRSNTKVKVTISGLKSKTLYHFRVVGENETGIGPGLDQSTKTL